MILSLALLLAPSVVACPIHPTQSGSIGAIRSERQLLVSPAPNSSGQFGRNIAADADWVVVAEPGASVNSQSGGALQVYRRGPQGYTFFQTLLPADMFPSLRMGDTGVAINGDVLAAASYRYPDTANSTGAVYVYRFNGTQWVFNTRLEPSFTQSTPTFFGTSITITDDETVLVSAPQHMNQSTTPEWFGSVTSFVPSGSTWVEEEVIRVPRVAPLLTTGNSNAGASLASHGNRVLVGIQYGSPGGHVASLIERDPQGDWSLVDQIEVNSAAIFFEDEFSIALSANRIVVGSYHGNAQWVSGHATVFIESGGTYVEEKVLVPSDPSPTINEQFGSSVAIEGDRIAIGSRRKRIGLETYGQGYLYELESGVWEEVGRYRASGVTPGNIGSLGKSVALANSAMIVSDEHYDHLNNTQAGGVLVFQEPLGEITCFGKVNSTGSSSYLNPLGSTEVGTGQLVCQVSGLPLGFAGILVAGTQGGFTANPAGSMGDLCLGGSLARFNQTAYFPDANGVVEVTVDMSAIPVIPNQPILAGETWHFQYWHRDFVSGSTSNLSSTRAILFE